MKNGQKANGLKQGAGSESDAFVPPKSIWLDLIESCKNRDICPALVTCPERYKDDRSVAKRNGVLKELYHVRNWPSPAILTLCPVDPSTFWRAVKKI